MRRDQVYHALGLGLILGWLLAWGTSFFLDPSLPIWVLGASVFLGIGLSVTPVGHAFAAFFGHLSFALIALAFAALLYLGGYELATTPLWAKLVYLGASFVFYASVLGFIRVDIYAWFYNLMPRLILLCGLVAYAVVFQDMFVGVATVLGYALYLAEVRANNPLDHLHHFLAPFCVIISLF